MWEIKVERFPQLTRPAAARMQRPRLTRDKGWVPDYGFSLDITSATYEMNPEMQKGSPLQKAAFLLMIGIRNIYKVISYKSSHK
ncbi:hypothetical protein [Hymenobacter ruricola]|uniref:Uncharacterized protein n=1 Tax=Hymenobacter ruricola TaxID=2791023 RepID=A0ABS0I7D6_9BACT|nr:hypothetical protein [Hymenobacter ruricola]MBF9222881.1 hypothetical protein [Hymenobacter ruricola]